VSETHINPLLVTYSWVASTNSSTYEWTDPEFTLDGSYDWYAYYYVKAYNSGSGSYSSRTNIIDVGGDFTPYKRNAEENVINTVPEKTELYQNYPNPFNPATKISYTISEEAKIQVKIYDMLGTEVSELVNEVLASGYYETTFDASNLSSGVYIYRITAIKDDKVLFSQSKQMILLK